MRFHHARRNQSSTKSSDVALFFEFWFNVECERVPVRAIALPEFTGGGAERLRFMLMTGKILLINQHHTHRIAVNVCCYWNSSVQRETPLKQVLGEDDGHYFNSNMNMDVSHCATFSKPDHFKKSLRVTIDTHDNGIIAFCSIHACLSRFTCNSILQLSNTPLVAALPCISS